MSLHEQKFSYTGTAGVPQPITFGHTFHGDIYINAGPNIYHLAHGNEPQLFAAGIGYLRRLGRSTEELIKLTNNAVPCANPHSNDVWRRPDHTSLYMLHGKPMPRFDISELDWEGLSYQMSPVPGNSTAGGTQLFATKFPMGSINQRALVIARLPGLDSGADKLKDSATYLAPNDIPKYLVHSRALH